MWWDRGFGLDESKTLIEIRDVSFKLSKKTQIYLFGIYCLESMKKCVLSLDRFHTRNWEALYIFKQDVHNLSKFIDRYIEHFLFRKCIYLKLLDQLLIRFVVTMVKLHAFSSNITACYHFATNSFTGKKVKHLK